METTSQLFLLGNQPMPVRFAGKETFKQSGTPASYSYMLVSSDTSDGLQELLLYRKEEKNITLLGRRKLPVSFRSGLAQKMTSILFQQVWYCRQNPDTSLESFLRDFSTLFVRTEQSAALLKQLSMLCTQQQASYDYDTLYRIVAQLLDKCQWNQDAYKNYIAKKMKHHPMRILYKSNFLDWLNFCQLAGDFLSEFKEWKKDDYPMLSFYCCGSSYMTALISYVRMQQSEKESGKQQVLNPEKDTDIFQQTELIFKSTQQNLKGFMLRISSTPYETQIIRAYNVLQKEKARQAQNAVYPLYAEKALCLPKDAAVHVGKWQGLQRPVSSADGAEEYTMPAPLSEEFAALVASGKAKILVQNWTKQADGWLFHMEYAYKNRTADQPYRPVDKYYSQEQIISVENFPEILVKQKKGQKDLSILAQQSAYSVAMSEALLDGTSLKLAIPEKMPVNYMLYFKLFDSNQNYLGQFDCNLTPAEGGTAS